MQSCLNTFFHTVITNYHLNFPFAIYFSSFLQPLINNQLLINKVTYKQWCLDMCSDHAWGDQIAATILRHMLDVSTVIKIHHKTCILIEFNTISTETDVFQ